MCTNNIFWSEFLFFFSPSLQTQETPPEVLSGERVSRDQDTGFPPVRQGARENQTRGVSVRVHKHLCKGFFVVKSFFKRDKMVTPVYVDGNRKNELNMT